jgi:hypothetical protein
MIVVTVVSLRVGQVTFLRSWLTCRKNSTGLFFAMSPDPVTNSFRSDA